MNDALFMRGIERVGNLAGEREGRSDGNWTASDLFGQRLAIDQLHHQRGDAADLFDTVDGRYMWVIDRRERPGFALETLYASRV